MHEIAAANLKLSSATAAASSELLMSSPSPSLTLTSPVPVSSQCSSPANVSDVPMPSFSSSSIASSSEDLQYGPGIVTKLKNKYLSLTMRENRCFLRKSNSLENILDNCEYNCYQSTRTSTDKSTNGQNTNNESNANSFVTKLPLFVLSSSSASSSPSLILQNEQRKRAQSMDSLDYLQKEEIHEMHNSNYACCNNGPATTTSVRNIDLIISNLKKNLNVNYVPQRKLAHRQHQHRQQFYLNETERPPQDVVKRTKRFFEVAANRKQRASNTAGSHSDVALKIANFKMIIQSEKLLAKKKLIKRPAGTGTGTAVGATGQQHSKIMQSNDFPSGKKVLETIDCNIQSYSVINKVLPYLKDLETSADEPTVRKPVASKHISREQLNALKKSGTSVPISINSCGNKSHLPATAVYHSRRANFNRTSVPSHAVGATNKQIGIIKPLITNKLPAFQTDIGNKTKCDDGATSDRVNNNNNNNENNKNIDTDTTTSSSDGGGSVGSNSSKISSKAKTNANDTSNSVVFNFSNRKTVPDYVENDGVLLYSKREKFKPSKSVIKSQLRNGERKRKDNNNDDIDNCNYNNGDGVEEDLNSADNDNDDDDDDDDDGDEYDSSLLSGPPSPCNISFTNDNILIDGKSSMSTKCIKRQKLRIQFDDSATKLFEYPSELSLLKDDNNDKVNGNSNLSNYVPTKLSLADSEFRLGITKSALAQNASQTNGGVVAAEECMETNSASESIITPWNAVTTTDLLF